ncbi:MAG TPA: beta-1,3-glucanase family protein, partial [Armatimonadota bacterium]|nr:beta-1,3-glucanase family protein [Armatimonadota bacterium]
MFTVSISVPDDVLQAGGGAVQVAMYGQLLAPYTPTSGPGANTPLAADQWVYYTGTDYAAAAAPVPAFATYTTAGTQTLTLPDVQVQAAHVVFGLGTLPAITLDSGGAPQQPDPVTTTGIYDFVEFTYNLQDTLYLNTTMIDQFGIPIQIQIDPASAMLPSGAGVTAPRSSVFSQYQQYATGSNAAFLQCAQDAFGNALTTRLLAPKNTLVANSPQGVQASVFTGPPSTLAAGSYYDAVTAVNSTGVESFAQNNVVAATITNAGQAVNVAWAPNTLQPAGTASYNLYRGT